MIKSHNGKLSIDGNNGELLFELGHIIEYFSHKDTLALLAVLNYHEQELEELEKMLKNEDSHLLQMITEFYGDSIETRRSKNDNR